MAGTTNVKYIEFPVQNRERDGLGSDWYPSIEPHARMAQQWIKVLRADMGR